MKRRRAAAGAIVAGVVAAAAIALAIALGAGVAAHRSAQLATAPAERAAVDTRAAAERLAGAVRIRTIASDSGEAPADAFRALHAYLAERFPRVHASLERETVSELSLLYTWRGSDASAAPLVLLAHQDVVPIAPGTEGDWTHAPFSGDIVDGHVWGRGTMDDKGSLLAQLEAVEMLLAQGFRPTRTIHLAFGHDEETAGVHGARAIAARFRERGIRPALVLDEGMLITDGILKGLSAPAALVGVAEKGVLNLKLSTAVPGGHSSMPAPVTAIGTLSRALARLEADPMPARIAGPTRAMFEALAPEMGGANRLLLSNLWLFAPLVSRELQKATNTNAIVRTTTAVTMFSAGNKVNVLPGQAEAYVNFRLLPGDSIDDVIAHVRRAIGDGAVRIEPVFDATEASRVTSPGAPGYRLVERTLRELHPDVLVVPALAIVQTDSRHFDGLADAVLRFVPVRARSEDLARVHGTNERMSIEHYGDMIRFYHRLMRNFAAAP